MKQYFQRWTAAGICALALLGGAVAEAGQGMVEEYSGVSFVKEGLEFFKAGKLLKTVDFSKESGIWDTAKGKNYQDYLDIQFDKDMNGVKALFVGGGKPRKDTDTAWQIKSKTIPVEVNGSRFALDLEMASDFSINGIRGKGYTSTVNWHDKDGKVLSSVPLKLMSSQVSFHDSRTLGEIPEGAKSFSVTLGFDSPNVDVGHYCAFSKISLYTLEENSPYIPQAWLQTIPYMLEDRAISWTAECPAGTAVKVQVSDADDADGLPGAWSPYHGPDGTADTWFTKPFTAQKKWLKLRLLLQTSSNSVPQLKSFSLNGETLTAWELYRSKLEPLFENLTVSPTHNRREDIVIRVTGMSPIIWKTFTAKIDGKEATSLFTRNGNILTGKATTDYADGLHKIELSVRDLAGKEAKSTKYLLLGDSPANVPHVTVRDDGMTLVDGKPMFPIGAYSVCKREFNGNDLDKAVKDLSEAGFNFVHTYARSQNAELMEKAQKYGIRVWAAAYDIHDKDFLQNRLNHPSVIAWYIGDDTSGHWTPNELQDRHDALKAIDDHRITTQADGVGASYAISSYRDYVRGTDNFLPEIYPVNVDTPEDRGSCVAKVIRDMKTCASDIDKCGIPHPKSIWSIIQYFQGWSSWKRFPEENEIRAMSFASIIHGATGITWYTYGGFYDAKNNRLNQGITSTPERWRIITTITRQLRELEPVIVERAAKEQPEVRIVSGPQTDALGHPAVTCLMKKHEGESYILAVNSTLENVKVTIPVAGIKTGSVMFENRSAAVSGGMLSDTFKPYDVHIYRLK